MAVKIVLLIIFFTVMIGIDRISDLRSANSARDMLIFSSVPFSRRSALAFASCARFVSISSGHSQDWARTVTMIGIGIYSRKKATDVNGFVLGGRSVGPWLRHAHRLASIALSKKIRHRHRMQMLCHNAGSSSLIKTSFEECKRQERST